MRWSRVIRRDRHPARRKSLELRQEKPNEIRHNGLTYSGILVEMAKTDNKLQLINPAAPPEYGTAEDNEVRDPNTGGARGFEILFSIGF